MQILWSIRLSLTIIDCTQPPSLGANDDDVMDLFDDVTTFLDSAHAAIQASPNSPTSRFSTVEEAQATVTQLMKSTIRSAIDNEVTKLVGS